VFVSVLTDIDPIDTAMRHPVLVLNPSGVITAELEGRDA